EGEVKPKLSAAGFPQITFRPGYHNYGQTPAWVLQVDTVVCEEPLPPKPRYEIGKQIVISDSARPNGEEIPFSGPVVIEMRASTLRYYGRFPYVDMLGTRRHSSFVYRLRNNGGHEPIHIAGTSTARKSASRRHSPESKSPISSCRFVSFGYGDDKKA